MRDLRAMLVIARRELVERVRSRWFAAMTLLGPLGMVAIVLVPVLLAGTGEGARVDIVDRSGRLARPLADVLERARWAPAVVAVDPRTPADQILAAEKARIRDKQINGFVLIPPDVADGGRIVYLGDNGSSLAVQATLTAAVTHVVQQARGQDARIAPEVLARVTAPVAFEPQQTDGVSEGASGAASYWLGYILAYVLMLVIMLYAVGVMRSVVQEKTSRVMELMVATVKPRSLMAGKILGVGAAGLVQVAIWLAMGAITLAYRDEILGLFGKAPTGAALPVLAGGEIALALAFFILGYFFYASMYAAVGAMVSSEQDTQQVQMPITMLLVIGFACVTMVGGDPRGLTATILTMLPFWSALLMPMRYLLGGASLIEVALSLAILAGSTVLLARAAAKIYRVGVLMYGKRPTLGELVRWLRY
ncbi:MAG TPA: ABC transporter permease [Kofleriaceae bacterium]|nr:ABC transporter permease [Kofleriaceae bacterium]